MSIHLKKVRTLEQARHWFEAEGVTVSDWAKENGFPREVVYAVLAGRTRGRRGCAHEVAVALGIKPAPKGRANSEAYESEINSGVSTKENLMPP